VKRTFAWILACASLAALCLPTRAQQPAKVTHIGYLAGVSATADAPRLKAFQNGLRELGYVEGQNVVIEYRHENRELERLADSAAELVRLKPDILVAVTTNAALAARKATATIPIVFMGVTDPVAAGLVESLARPGGNSTGVTNMAAVLAGKRLEFLKETVPRIGRVAVLWDPQAPGSVPQWKEAQLAAAKLGVQLHSMEASNTEDYEGVFKEAVKARSGAIMMTLNPLANSNQKELAELAINARLPSICARADYAENGCLMAYGPGYSIEGRDGARYVDRILRGGKPAEIPVEQPTKFEFIVNLKTARRIGVTVPESVLNQADVVIQ
jgi:putative ABC transport system substrate-binding protein